MGSGLLLGLVLSLSLCLRAGSGLRVVTEYFTQGPEKLSFYHFYTNVKLFHFSLPEDTTLALWNLVAFKERGAGLGQDCPDHDIFVYLRAGAPPVVNPLNTSFPDNTLVPGLLSLTLPWVSPNKTTGSLNITAPLPGPWFLAAHLPRDDGKISVKGLTAECHYLFQPQLIVQRVTGLPILYPHSPLPLEILNGNSSVLSKVYVPEFSTLLTISVTNCSVAGSQAGNGSLTSCPVRIQLRPKAPPVSNSSARDCSRSGGAECSLSVSPLWGVWYYISVEKLATNANVTFLISALVTDCSQYGPVVSGYQRDADLSLSGNWSARMDAPAGVPELCLPVRPTLRNDLNTLSTQFFVFYGPNVTVTSASPVTLSLQLGPLLDGGATLNFEIALNMSSVQGHNVTVLACLNPDVPLVSLNSTLACSTMSSEGSLVWVRPGAERARLLLPFPQPGRWYVTLRNLCGTNSSLAECANTSAQVSLRMFLSPCIDSCGTYGECHLLRSYSYMLAACRCRADWDGWGCTDGSNALSYGEQMIHVILLTFSNLLFIPPIIIALRNHLLMEASVYTYTMFFSTFYHACDQPGVTVLCIMDYDVLQYCDFFGSLMCVWVTLICMARLQTVAKEVLYLLGALVLAMVVQMDRHGLWNLLGPTLFALVLLAIAWAVRMVRRRHCYPPSWRRWVFFLLPGTVIALTAVMLYVVVETDKNYYYTHSLWHMLIAGSLSFLLPPRGRRVTPLQKVQRKGCGYRLCIDEPDDTQPLEPVLLNVNSVCPL
ncbi:transmembrane protein 8B-like [Lethenteron reissneri]|uniref:transmembrane protein 8B-like n=1 Tax=Lethenteron reissneri TaxID=7753 RepID=UPI002AB7602D|nr:transmembrane protein 8B-like [Lethenteron reissneri]